MSNTVIRTAQESLLGYGWLEKHCVKCGIRIYKYLKAADRCPDCDASFPIYSSKARPYKSDDFSKFISRFRFHFSSAKLPISNALPIHHTRSNNIFVGSGLEYLDAFRFNGTNLPLLPSLIIQPSIRLRGGVSKFSNYTTNYTSIAFLNASLLQHNINPNEFSLLINDILMLMERLEISLKRITLTTVKKDRVFSDGLRAECVIGIFVDGLGVGDYVYLNNDNYTLVETGYGLERLASVSACRPHYQILQANNKTLPLELLIHALALISMSKIPFSRSDIWSKARSMANIIQTGYGEIDTYPSFERMYKYWFPFVAHPEHKHLSYHIFKNLFSNLTLKTNKDYLHD